MTEYKNEKNNLSKLITPKYFFATFRTEEAYLIANNAEVDFIYKGWHIKVEEAMEPTDMIWENRQFNTN